MVNGFLLGRLGNKQNDIKFFKHLLPKDKTIIIEPFCGSFAVIRNLYKDKKFIKICNDNDSNLIYICQNHYKYLNFVNEIHNKINKFITPDKPFLFKEIINHVKEYKELEPIFYDFWYKSHVLRNSIIKVNKNEPIKDINIFNEIEFYNKDYKEIINIYKDNENAFIFLDPPYMFSDNKNYKSNLEDKDNTNMIYEIYEFITTCKCSVMLIINDLKFLRWLFKDYIKGEYERIYQIGKKHDTHLIITNY